MVQPFYNILLTWTTRFVESMTVVEKCIEIAVAQYNAFTDAYQVHLNPYIPVKVLNRLIIDCLPMGDVVHWFEEQLLLHSLKFDPKLMEKVCNSEHPLCKRYKQLIKAEFGEFALHKWLGLVAPCNRTLCQNPCRICWCDDPLTYPVVRQRCALLSR